MTTSIQLSRLVVWTSALDRLDENQRLREVAMGSSADRGVNVRGPEIGLCVLALGVLREQMDAEPLKWVSAVAEVDQLVRKLRRTT